MVNFELGTVELAAANLQLMLQNIAGQDKTLEQLSGFRAWPGNPWPVLEIPDNVYKFICEVSIAMPIILQEVSSIYLKKYQTDGLVAPPSSVF